MRTEWADELEAAVRDSDYRVRAQAYRAIGQFRFRQKLELLRRGLEDESPAARGGAIISLELLSREHPGAVNGVRPLLHSILSSDPNSAVRRLAAAALRNGSPQRETIVLLTGIAEDDRQDDDVRAAARKVAHELTKRSRAR
jgi:HEAT repeat protein